jgi:hypothetical protein
MFICTVLLVHKDISVYKAFDCCLHNALLNLLQLLQYFTSVICGAHMQQIILHVSKLTITKCSTAAHQYSYMKREQCAINTSAALYYQCCAVVTKQTCRATLLVQCKLTTTCCNCNAILLLQMLLPADCML